MIPAGSRHAYMTLERNSSTGINADGISTVTWTAQQNWWCAIVTPESASRERWISPQVVPQISHVLSGPWMNDVRPTDRFTYYNGITTRTFNISGQPIDLNDMHMELVIPVTEDLGMIST